MNTKDKITDRINMLKEFLPDLEGDFYGRDYVCYIEDEIEFLEQLLKDLYLD